MAEDILDDALEDSSNEIKDRKKISLKKMFERILGYKKVILIIAVSLFVLISLVAGGRLFFFKGSAGDVQESMTSSKDSLPETAWGNDVVFEDIVDLEPFERIQLKGTSAMGLISIHLSLELTDHQYSNQFYTMQDRIRKIITGQVEEMTWLVLRNPEGKIMLKYNLLKRINSIFPKPAVGNVYFTYFIMQ